MSTTNTLTSASQERTVIAAALEAAIEEIRKEQADIRLELKSNTENTAKIMAEQASMKTDLKANTENTSQIKVMTEELIDLFTAAKGAFKVMGWIGKGVTWVGGVSAALLGIWILMKGGIPPK